MQDFMTPEEVADFIKVPTATVLGLIQTGSLSASHVGGVYRIAWNDLRQYLATNDSHFDVGRALFERVLAIAERNPGVDSEDVLEELEQLDAERRGVPSS
jgi:excisionase family DNA binding protein